MFSCYFLSSHELSNYFGPGSYVLRGVPMFKATLWSRPKNRENTPLHKYICVSMYVYKYIYNIYLIYIINIYIIYIYTYIYGIHHRRILWSNYRKLARVGFDPTTTVFRSDALTDWAIRPCVQLALRANYSYIYIYSYIIPRIY